MKKLVVLCMFTLITLLYPLQSLAEINKSSRSLNSSFILSLYYGPPNPEDPEPEPEPVPEPEPEPVPEPEPEPEPSPPPAPQPPAQPRPNPPSEPRPPAQPAPANPGPSTPAQPPAASPVEEEEEPVEEVAEEELEAEEAVTIVNIDEHGDVLLSWKEKFEYLPLPILYDVLKSFLNEGTILNLDFLTKKELEELWLFLENEELVSTEQFEVLRSEISTLLENKEEDAVVEVVAEEIEETGEAVMNESTAIPLVEGSNTDSNKSFIGKIGAFFGSIGSFFKGLFS
jgi:type IV secretory pathway VirB10-like protein